MNPANIVQQMSEVCAELYGVIGQTTSLKPLRLENMPDEWEKEALQAFESGAMERLDFTTISKDPFLRFMQPMKVEKSCLKCHGHQGYQVGEVREGVSINLPMKDYRARRARGNIHPHILVQSLVDIGIKWDNSGE